MQHSAETDAELLREMDEKLQSLRSKVDGLCKTEREVLKLTRQLKDVEECLAKLKAANKDIKRIQTSQGEQDSAMRELTVQEQSLRRQLHNISARAAELDARQRLKREAADREKEKWKNAAAGADKENEAAELEMERMSEESRLAEKRLQDLQNLEQAESSKFAEEKALVEERVRGVRGGVRGGAAPRPQQRRHAVVLPQPQRVHRGEPRILVGAGIAGAGSGCIAAARCAACR